MAHLKKDHVLGAGASAAAGGATGAALGSVLGPAGMALGAAIGGAAGAVAGDRLAERLDPRGDLGRFEQIHHTMDYFVSGMDWEDYRPAYRQGIDLAHRGQPLDPQAFLQAWPASKERSRLTGPQALAAATHAHEQVLAA